MSIENRGFSEPNPEQARQEKDIHASENVTIGLMQEALDKVTDAKRKVAQLRNSGEDVESLWGEIDRLEGIFANKLMEIPENQEEIDEQRKLYATIKEKYIDINETLEKACDASLKKKIGELEKEVAEAKKQFESVFELVNLPSHPEHN